MRLEWFKSDMSDSDLFPQTKELRHVKPGFLFELARILEPDDSWKLLMSIIPRDVDNFDGPLKYTVEDMRLIEQASAKQGRTCSEILFEEWSTSGKKRPTFETILQCLTKVDLYRAADFVASHLHNVPQPARPTVGPAAAISIEEVLKDETYSDIIFEPMASTKSVETVVNEPIISIVTDTLDEQKTNDSVFSVQFKDTVICGNAQIKMTNEGSPSTNKSINVEIEPFDFKLNSAEGRTTSSVSTVNTVITQKSNKIDIRHENSTIPYEVIQNSTNNFDETREVGSGAFGTVYHGIINHTEVAIKILKKVDSRIDLMDFKTELHVLTRCNHKNILTLIGICEQPVPCIVYQFMPNGSLEHRIACKTGSKPLIWEKRVIIASDVADGLRYLHFTLEKPIIHRDIKSANILLDQHDNAKIGDFGLVRATSPSLTTIVTETVKGTSAYMSPEAFRGDVSVQMDVYSFGVVLLELITGLPPYDETRDGTDLVTHIDTSDWELENMVDPKSGKWNATVLHTMIALADNCLKEKRTRPYSKDICKTLENIIPYVAND